MPSSSCSRSFAWLPLALLALAACSQNADAEPGDADEGALGLDDFAVKLTCDEGAAVLDVGTRTYDVDELSNGRMERTRHRKAQFVVRRSDVVEKLSARVDHVRSQSGEVILRSSMRDGEDFSFFEDESFGSAATRDEGNRVRIRESTVAVVHRVNGSSNEVRVVFNKRTERMTCATYFNERAAACAFDERARRPVEVQIEKHDEPIVDHVFRCASP